MEVTSESKITKSCVDYKYMLASPVDIKRYKQLAEY